MIRVENLSKYYGGKRALGPVSFEIEDGETVGFLGLNGAGKTTALRILACDLRPSSGTVSVGDVDVLANPHAVRKRIGFLPESPPLYVDMTVTDYLHFAGRLRKMSKAEVLERMPGVLEITNLTDASDEIIATLSHGYRQRVGVAQAIIHEPQLLILDEPTRGLDPVQIVEMRTMVQNLKENHTVLISSHILTEISQTCDRLLVLGNGAIIAAGSETELAGNLVEVKYVTVTLRPIADDGDGDAIATALEGIEGVTDAKRSAGVNGEMVFKLECDSDIRAAVAKTVVEGGHDLLRLDDAHGELEGTFLWCSAASWARICAPRSATS